MNRLAKGKIIDVSFEMGLLLKGLFATGEILSGIALSYLTPARMNRLISWLSLGELREDPRDWLMNYLVMLGHSFSSGVQHFAMLYALSHGVAKLTLILLLWRKKLWAYPLSVLAFCGFVVYQMYHFTFSHSPLLLLLTALDLAMIILTILEYRKMRAAKP